MRTRELRALPQRRRLPQTVPRRAVGDGANLRNYLKALSDGARDFRNLPARGIDLALEADDGEVVLSLGACRRSASW